MGRLLLLRQGAEALVMFAILLAIDLLVLHGNAFEGTNPNPYWWPILIMALAYGSGMGLLAAGIASAIWLIAPHSPPPGADKLQTISGVSLHPLMWTVAALLVGEVTAVRKLALAESQRRRSELELEEATIATVLDQIAAANREMQVRIATNERTVGKAIDIATGLMSADLRAREETIKRLIALACQTDAFTFLEARNEQLVPRLEGDAAAPQLSIPSSDGAQADGGSLSLPVYEAPGKQVAGVLLIHSVDPSLRTEAKLAELDQVARAVPLMLAEDANARIEDSPWQEVEDKVA